MELFIYKGEWGLPSIDFDCNRVLAFAKFSGVNDLKINTNANPFKSPSGMLPYLVVENKKIAGYTKIIEYFQAKGFNCSKDMQLDYILVNGYIQFMFENLYPLFEYLKWGDPKNVDTTRALYAKRTPFPFNFYCPRKYVQKANDITEHLASFSLEDSIDKHDIIEMTLNAKKCINWIAEKIADKKWFFGSKPCEIDAVIYGYLSVIFYMKLPNNILQIHLQQSPNLVKFVERITNEYFVQEGFCSPNLKQTSEKPIYTGKEDEESPEIVRRRYFFSGLVAVLAMVGFALVNGIVSIARHDDHGFIPYDDDHEEVLEDE